MANMWFRFYAEFINDPKVQMLSHADQRHYIMLLCIRCSNGDVTFHETALAFQLRVSVEEWREIRNTLIASRLIDNDAQPLGWDSRQYISDSSTSRVKKFREKNVKRPRNVSVTPPEAEAEADTEAEQQQKGAAAAPNSIYVDKCIEVIMQHLPHLKACNTAKIHEWEAVGYDITRHVLPTVLAAKARANPPRSIMLLGLMLQDLFKDNLSKAAAAPTPAQILTPEQAEANREWRRKHGLYVSDSPAQHKAFGNGKNAPPASLPAPVVSNNPASPLPGEQIAV